MMTRNWIFSLVAAALLAETSCSESQKPPQPTIINGVKVDLAKFQQALSSASPDLQSSVGRVSMAIRYGQVPEAVAELEKLANNPGLTEPQKKVATEVLAQLKQVVSQSPPKSAP